MRNESEPLFWTVVIVGVFYFLGKEDKGTSSSTATGTTISVPSSVSLESDHSNNTSSRPLYFGAYPCTSDCSGHEAGYEWAENNGISDPDECSGTRTHSSKVV